MFESPNSFFTIESEFSNKFGKKRSKIFEFETIRSKRMKKAESSIKVESLDLNEEELKSETSQKVENSDKFENSNKFEQSKVKMSFDEDTPLSEKKRKKTKKVENSNKFENSNNHLMKTFLCQKRREKDLKFEQM